MKVYTLVATTAVIAGLQVGCIPNSLRKYMDKPSEPVSASPAETPATVTAAPAPAAAAEPASENKATIYAIGNSVFRFHIAGPQVWESAINVLMANYNITTLDRASGVMTTEWDSYYLKDKAYRNKISLHIRNTAWDTVDVVVYNNVEVLNQAGSSDDTKIWLPAGENKQEVGRIIQNMAAYLKQPAPRLPEGMIARSTP
jgi:hypothetical protein